MAGAIFGDWTHRRVDAGGSRAIAADLLFAKPRVAWTWDAPPRTRIDQVRTSAGAVIAATMSAHEEGPPGWDHATLFALDGESGRVIARRTLPDPCPVAALVVEARVIHAIATRVGEPVFWYALSAPDLAPLHRRPLRVAPGMRTDVVDAWAQPGGGLWLELEDGRPSSVFVSVEDASEGLLSRFEQPRDEGEKAGRVPHDACEIGRSLVVPADALGQGHKGPRAALYRLSPDAAATPSAPAKEYGGPERRSGARRAEWARADCGGVACSAHALSAEGLVLAAILGDHGDKLVAEVSALDRTTGVERWRTARAQVSSASAAEEKRMAYLAGELVGQTLDASGAPASDLLLAGPRGAIETAILGTHRRFVLDAATGGTVLAHAPKSGGRAVVAGFAIDKEGGILGRRARMLYSVETPSVGEEARVYAGAGKIVVKGDRRLVAVAV